MNRPDISVLLAGCPALSSHFSHPPRTFLLPMGTDPTSRYLIVWCYFDRNTVTLDLLWVCLCQVMRSVWAIMKRERIQGLEIVPAVLTSDGECDRILRLSIFVDSIPDLLEKSADCICDIRPLAAPIIGTAAVPVEGATCLWYWKPLSLEFFQELRN
jgi:hypothetical protein